MATDPSAAIAAHRFGLGETTLDTLRGDPRGWLEAQIGPADAQRGDDLPTASQAVVRYAEFVREQRRQRQARSEAAPAMAPASAAPEPIRQAVQADQRARLLTAVTTQRPFAERLALFWANHFSVSTLKASMRGLAGAFEREAIRPNIAASFETLLNAAVTHAGPLRYLDNEQSAGPNSRFAQRVARRQAADGDEMPRKVGLNENLAREVLELHTLGAAAARANVYGQPDVTQFARVLTGWRIPVNDLLSQGGGTAVRFDAAWHEPGDKQVLGRRHAEGPDALRAVLHDLALHPATARHVCGKLARHFTADRPPPALVDRLVAAWLRSGGELPVVYRTLIASNEAWLPQPAKLKTPEEFVVSTARVLGLGEPALNRQPDGGTAAMGQRVQAAPSPAGWRDAEEEWLGPEAVWKRVEWATRVADRAGRSVDARALAQASLGPLLGATTQQQISRAADGPQALALLLLAPEFQRR
jgi:uncharacterized protein (DUF1800 family)